MFNLGLYLGFAIGFVIGLSISAWSLWEHRRENERKKNEQK